MIKRCVSALVLPFLGFQIAQAEPVKPTTQWISKTARVLRNGHGLGRWDDLKHLRSLTQDQVIEWFMKDHRFADTLLDFNLYFLGKNPNQLVFHERRNIFSEKGKSYFFRYYTSEALFFPAAVHSAIEGYQDGDYLVLFDLKQPFYAGQNSRAHLGPVTGGKETPEQEKLTDLEKIRIWKDRVSKAIDRLLAYAEEKGKDLDPKVFCERLNKESDISFFQGVALSSGAEFATSARAYALTVDLYYSCRRSEESSEAVAALKEFRRRSMAYLTDLESLDHRRYKTEKLTDLRTLDYKKYGIGDFENNFTFPFWFDFPNSSTNLNRKRAAHFLSRYFCDDLTPIAFVNPDEHSKDRHGSDPSCYACHYKLDPMAGFFRTIGFLGTDYSRAKYIVFDDQARAPIKEYEKNWKTKDGKWNVGFIRSATDPERNEYAENIEDLFKIIRMAPEAQRCVVKRLSEYFLGKETLLDAGYFDYLASHFVEEAKINSSRALKNTIKRILTSRTFVERDIDPTRCYDYAPGANPKNQPPCEVAYTFKTYCGKCHKSADGPGGIDLTRWIETSDGKYNFPHVDPEGKQYPLNHTLTQIADRISSKNSKKRMPLDAHMPNKDREKIFVWARTYKGGVK